jgi:hypothetical protein
MNRWAFAGLFALGILACGFGLFAIAFFFLMASHGLLLRALIPAFILGGLAVAIWLSIGVFKRLN